VPLLGQVACTLTRLKTHHPKQFLNKNTSGKPQKCGPNETKSYRGLIKKQFLNKNTSGKPQKCGPNETKSYRGLIKQMAKAIEKTIIYLCACIEFLCK
jgi:hypothetical protein